MEIIIRHQISDTEEEVYRFELCNSIIRYSGFYISRRITKTDVWGYDFEKTYASTVESEIRRFKNKNKILKHIHITKYRDGIQLIKDHYRSDKISY